MAKLTTEQASQHRKALALVDLDRDLTLTEREFVIDHYMETADARLDGAFFTPEGLARDMSIEVCGRRVIDLCAGIGRLAFACRDTDWERVNNEPPRELVCVERNPEYVRVGKKVLPEATWILGDVFDVPGMDLGDPFDIAIGNPPYGAVARGGRTAPRYTGGRFEYHVIDIAATVARRGVFIVPQEMAPFRYSGRTSFTEERIDAYNRFERQTGITLGPSVGIDTSHYLNEWRDAAPRTEIVCADYANAHHSGTAPAVRLAPEPRPSRDWTGMGATDFSTRPKAAQVAMFDVGDDAATGTIGLFDV
ncbi:methyltransferase [Streptomyces globisporus]|uniref:Methyltransferase n=1 Tax=Streptomyces globisporus TaxID=1908 RepID=A0A927BN55_STRGL|nr:methyltransferase [Streptomyces globisporus]